MITGINPLLFRACLGEELRLRRQDRSLSLRDLSRLAGVSGGYISEIERGQKEASSELLLSVCGALDVPLSQVLRQVADRMEAAEAVPAYSAA